MTALGPHAETGARGGGAKTVAVGRVGQFRADLDIEHLAAALGHRDQEIRTLGAQLVRRLRERDRRHARQPVQPVIAQHGGSRLDLGRMRHAALRPGRAAHLEHVAEIGGKVQ